MLESDKPVQDAFRRLSALSPREMEVARLVCCGNPSKVIAFKLGIAAKTVEEHRARVIGKTGCLSLVEFARLWEASLTDRVRGVPSTF